MIIETHTSSQCLQAWFKTDVCFPCSLWVTWLGTSTYHTTGTTNIINLHWISVGALAAMRGYPAAPESIDSQHWRCEKSIVSVNRRR